MTNEIKNSDLKNRGKILKNLQRVRNEQNVKVLNQIMFKKLDKYLEKTNDVSAVLLQGKIVANETLNGFKNLKNDFSESLPSVATRNKEILEKLKSLQTIPQKNFEFELEKQALAEMRVNYKVREKFLWDAYCELDVEIKKKKEMINEIRKILADLAIKKKRNMEDVRISF